ncbi:MAG: ABC transporter ATP-binding protein [Spirochaetales bacterium]|nr:ABC transporter ATP-binding protein [Spirochaetales bacterium]
MSALLRTFDLGYGVKVGRKEKTLVQNIHISLEPGKLVGLIGPNGAGKSTLLGLLLGYLKPTQGLVEIEGKNLRNLKDKERARTLSYLGQSRVLHFPFTLQEIVEMGSYANPDGLGFPGKSEKARARDALRYVGLEGLRDRNFLTLSGGEQQLGLFARILVQNTPIVLLDEPTSSLDLGHEAQLLEMARELALEGRVVLTALHNLNSAAEYCHRLILMDKGNLVADGEPAEVLSQERVEKSYATRVRVGNNENTGSITVTPLPRSTNRGPGKVHIIGGAGSGVTLTRQLYLWGISLSGGVAHELDSDAKLWRALGIPLVEVPAFSEIPLQTLSQAHQMVREADLTILCSFPFGRGNRGNLELARAAAQKGSLVVLDEVSGTCQRGFYAPGLKEDFDSLQSENPPVSYEECLETVKKVVHEVAL